MHASGVPLLNRVSRLLSILPFSRRYYSIRGTGWIRYAYLTLLTTHTILAVVNLPLIVVTLGYALSEKFSSHRKIAHWTYPIWMYVSVTGVVVYYLLYIAYTPIGAPWLQR